MSAIGILILYGLIVNVLEDWHDEEIERRKKDNVL